MNQFFEFVNKIYKYYVFYTQEYENKSRLFVKIVHIKLF